MDSTAKAAFIMAQAALLNAEIAMMQAANKDREQRGCSIAYGEKEFYDVFARYESNIGYNPCIEYLRG